jgi:hypothetical protein
MGWSEAGHLSTGISLLLATVPAVVHEFVVDLVSEPYRTNHPGSVPTGLLSLQGRRCAVSVLLILKSQDSTGLVAPKPDFSLFNGSATSSSRALTSRK